MDHPCWCNICNVYQNFQSRTTHSSQKECVVAHQGYHHNIPCGATTPLGSVCRMGVPERAGGNKAVYCLN